MNKYFLIFLIGSFFFLRLYRIEERVNFSMDQGMFCVRALEIWKNKEITLLGPAASPKVDGRQFFQGPLIYYSIIGIMLISAWDPIRASLIMVVLNFFGLAFLWMAVKEIFDARVAKTAVVIWTFLPMIINFSNFIWNPNFLLFLTPVYLYLLTKTVIKRDCLWFLGIGIFCGMCLQFHFQMGLLIIGTAGFLMFKRVEIKNFFIWGIGVATGYSPLLVFDLRNNFYNIRTTWLWLTHGSRDAVEWQSYHLLVLWPIWVILVSAFLEKKFKSKSFIVLAFLILYSYWTVVTQKQAFMMPKDWNYKNLVRLSKVIEDERPREFNIVNLISGDTRFYSLRYLLIRAGIEPLSVDNYPQVKNLYVLSDEEKDVGENNVWEISSARPLSLARKWIVSDKFMLIKLTKGD